MDKLYLIIAALLASVGAWFFWHTAQSDGFNIISLIAIVLLGADNYRLRKTIKSAKSSSSGSPDL